MSNDTPYREPEEPAGVAARRRLEERSRAHHAQMQAQRDRRARLRGRMKWAFVALAVVTANALVFYPFAEGSTARALAFVGFAGVVSLFMAGIASIGLKNDPRSSESRGGADGVPPGGFH